MTDETMITAAEARALREAATPGPWGVVRESGTTNDPDAAHPDWHHTVRHVGGGETGHNAPWVADVAGACGNGWSEPGADAALIAAAPALALALEAAERSECILAATLADVERARQAERQRADELEAALKASGARVGVLEDALRWYADIGNWLEGRVTHVPEDPPHPALDGFDRFFCGYPPTGGAPAGSHGWDHAKRALLRAALVNCAHGWERVAAEEINAVLEGIDR